MLRRIRLISGLVLFVFVATHLVNHAWGLASLDALALAREVFVTAWRSWPGTIALYGALLVHFTVVLWTLYQRRTLRLKRSELIQVVLGVSIPLLLVQHVLGTRGMHEIFGAIDDYTYEILILWVFTPENGMIQMVLLAVTWGHGCVSLRFWLRLKPWYRQAAPYLFAAAIVLPLAATFGFVAAGREMAVLAREDPFWLEDAMAALNWPGQDAIAWYETWKFRGWLILGGILAFVMLARYGRLVIERRRGLIQLTYPNGRVVRVRPPITVLEASRDAGISHASVCGGRGRCSTCRIRVGAGAEHLEPPSAEEVKVLRRVGLPEQVRLACQLSPSRDLEVTPLLLANVDPREVLGKPSHLRESEREVAILFADLRSFTQFAEKKLPYDVVFVLNCYFQSMGQAVLRAGGEIDKFIGDGVMALFGADTGPEEACRRALFAAREMGTELEELNGSLKNDLKEPLRMGIGIHLGSVIVGEMGFGAATSFTAIGDAVNTASRFETATKDFDCQLVVSDEVVKRAGVELDADTLRELKVRGRVEAITVRAIDRAIDLPEIDIEDFTAGGRRRARRARRAARREGGPAPRPNPG